MGQLTFSFVLRMWLPAADPSSPAQEAQLGGTFSLALGDGLLAMLLVGQLTGVVLVHTTVIAIGVLSATLAGRLVRAVRIPARWNVLLSLALAQTTLFVWAETRRGHTQVQAVVAGESSGTRWSVLLACTYSKVERTPS